MECVQQCLHWYPQTYSTWGHTNMSKGSWANIQNKIPLNSQIYSGRIDSRDGCGQVFLEKYDKKDQGFSEYQCVHSDY